MVSGVYLGQMHVYLHWCKYMYRCYGFIIYTRNDKISYETKTWQRQQVRNYYIENRK